MFREAESCAGKIFCAQEINVVFREVVSCGGRQFFAQG